MKQKIYIGAAAIVMAGIFLLAGGKPVVAKAEKIKKVKIASAEKTVLINKKEKIKVYRYLTKNLNIIYRYNK